MKLRLVKPKEDSSSWYFEELEAYSKDGFYMDGLLVANLKHPKRVIRQDWDYVFVVDGDVGSGKSVFAMIAAYYCSNGIFNVEDICFTADAFKKRVLAAEKYTTIIFDEAFRGMSARSTLSAINRTLMSMMQEIRQKNLFIYIILPSIWDLDSFISLHRCQGLFHIEYKTIPTGRERGYFKFFNKRIMINFLKDRTKNKYRYPKRSSFMGRFTKFYPVDEKEYRKKKEGALDSFNPFEEEEEKISGATMEKLLKLGLTKEQIGGVFDKSKDAVRMAIQRAKKRSKSVLDELNIDPDAGDYEHEQGTDTSIYLKNGLEKPITKGEAHKVPFVSINNEEGDEL